MSRASEKPSIARPMEDLRKLMLLLEPEDRMRIAGLVVLLALAALAEIAGVSAVFPFMSVVANPDMVQNSTLLRRVFTVMGFTDPFRFLVFLGLLVLVAVVLSNTIAALAIWALQHFSQSLGNRMSQRVLRAYLASPYEQFLQHSPSSLMVTVVDEVFRLVNFIVLPALQLLGRVFVIVFVVIVIFVADYKLATIVTVIIGGVYGLLYVGMRTRLARLGEISAANLYRRYRIVHEAVGGIKEVKLFHQEAHFLRRFAAASRMYADAQVKSGLIGTLPRYALETVAFGSIVLAVLYLLSRTGNFSEAVPMLALYAVAGYRVIPAVQHVFSSLTQMRFGLSHVRQLLVDIDLISRYQNVDFSDEEAAPTPLTFNVGIRLSHLSLHYPGHERASLHNLSLSIPKDRTIGLVGPSGAGKTTALEVILGLLEPTAGGVFIDDLKLEGELKRSWQRLIGYVPQTIYLTDDTVVRNIAFGLPDERIEMEHVERAARLANAHDFIVRILPHGYQTRVGDRGISLSGGQRQRIAIARALYRDPPLLVLDEATSALDSASETAILEAITALARRKTIIIVAHRLSTIRNCDVIFLLEHGRFTDSGSYEELLARNETFRTMAQWAPAATSAGEM